MDITIDISLYPLKEDFKPIIWAFLKRLQSHSEIKVSTNGMSTHVYGEYDKVMLILTDEIKTTMLEEKAVVIIKMTTGIRDKSY